MTSKVSTHLPSHQRRRRGTGRFRAMTVPSAASCLARNTWICGEYISSRKDMILHDLHEHVVLTLVAVGAGFALSIPLSLFVRRFRRTESTVVGLTSILYGVPSVAL